MGITDFSVDILNRAIESKKPESVMELGAQNLYNQPKLPAPYAHEFYEPKGIKYNCIDMCKENGALDIDLSKPVKVEATHDLVTDFGTSEHVSKAGKHAIEAYYNCWKAKHDLLNEGGTMINENPKTGN